MGILDIFKKKKEGEADFGAGYDQGAGSPESFNKEFRPAFSDTGFQSSFNQPAQPVFNQPTSFQPQSFQQNNLGSSDIQLIIAKLDLINQRLEVLDRRLQVIEQIAKESR